MKVDKTLSRPTRVFCSGRVRVAGADASNLISPHLCAPLPPRDADVALGSQRSAADDVYTTPRSRDGLLTSSAFQLPVPRYVHTLLLSLSFAAAGSKGRQFPVLLFFLSVAAPGRPDFGGVQTTAVGLVVDEVKQVAANLLID